MISIDDTVVGTNATRRHRDRSNDSTTCGYCRQRVPKGHECPQKREALKERQCRFRECGATFKPTMHAQAYCCPRHKDQENDRLEYERRPKRAKEAASTVDAKAEVNTIAPLERVWERAATKAEQYVPVMGEALEKITRELMGLS